jgi:hypothetical protein
MNTTYELCSKEIERWGTVTLNITEYSTKFEINVFDEVTQDN